MTVRAGGATFPGRWLVGCDGGRSTVRKIGGFAFVGTDPEFTGYSVDAELADPEVLTPGRTYTATGMYTYARPGTIALVDFDGGAFHRGQPITREHIQAVLRRVSGTDVTLNALRLAATWTDRAYQATAYRRGRVLLAGDAAHIHSPLGGQGLNLGLGDAMNLGWKLAATIRGQAPCGLLDSYFDERHPEGARILDWSRAQVALMRPAPSSRALAAIVRDLIATRDGATYFAEKVWGLSLRYDLGGGHPLVGRSVPDFELVGENRVGELLRDGRGLLLDFAPDGRLQALANHWRGRIRYVAGVVADRPGVSAVLVRPDGVVAWPATAQQTTGRPRRRHAGSVSRRRRTHCGPSEALSVIPSAALTDASDRPIRRVQRFCRYADCFAPKRSAERALALAASSSRSLGWAVVSRLSNRRRATAATWSTAVSKASRFAFEGALKPDSLRTNWSAASRISSFVAGGSKLNSVLMLRHIGGRLLLLGP